MDIILEAACIGMGKAVYFLIADVGVIVFLKWGYPLLRQKAGEREVRIILAKLPNRYRTMSGLALKVSHEVLLLDHVVLSPDGIFVIKTKHHEGVISGSAKEQYWTHAINKKKTRFYNPVWENHGDVQTLRRVLKDYPDSTYWSIVGFSRRADVTGVSSETSVVYFDQLPEEILAKRRDEPLTDAQVEGIARVLERRNIRDNGERRNRTRKGKDRKTDKENRETLRLDAA